MSERWFRYVPHARVPEYEARGWKLVPVAGLYFHDIYSALMEYTGTGEPEA